MRPELFRIGNFAVKSYGIMVALGFNAAMIISYIRAKKRGFGTDSLINLLCISVLGGFIGSKLFYIIIHFGEFIKNPLSVLGTTGFVVYGGLITGIAVGYWYCGRKNIPFIKCLDLVSPQLAIAQGIGRIGCHLAGCCFGRETHSRFAVIFPENCMAPAGIPLVPVQLMSAFFDVALGIGLIVLSDSKKTYQSGTVSLLYALFYSVGRFFIEFLRNDGRGKIGALSTSQLIALCVLAFGGYILKKQKNKPVIVG